MILLMRCWLVFLLSAACWAAPAEEVVRQFYAVGASQTLKGNARWAAVQPLMTPRFYQAVRKASSVEDGGYNLKNSGIILFDAGMFQTHQQNFGRAEVGTSWRQGDATIVPVRTVNEHFNNLTSRSEFSLLRSGESYQIDDIFHYHEGKRLPSYRESALKIYQQLRNRK